MLPTPAIHHLSWDKQFNDPLSEDFSVAFGKMVSIDDLPDEVLLLIFQYSSLEELLTLQQVNHRWRQIASDRVFFTSVSFTESESNLFVASVLYRFNNFIRHLSIAERSDIDTLAPAMAACQHLESLSVKLCTGNGDEFLSGIKNCSRLNVLVLQHTPIQNMNELLRILSGRPMKKINIRNMDADVRYDDLSSLRGVEDLRLKSIRVHANAVYQFCSHNAEYLTTLKLIVCDTSWLDSSTDLNETVFKAIGNCRHLKSLCLGPQITSTLNDTGFSQIARLESLHTFQIHNAICVSSSAFKAFFGRPSSTNLRKLSLHKCPSIDSSVLQQLSERCRQLEKFTLEKSKACKTERDLHDIIILVRNCSRIRQLHLYGMDIIMAPALHLMPKYLPKLESLKYSNSDKPMEIPAFLFSLQNTMPDFEVCGMQWSYNLYAHCKKKKEVKVPKLDDLICGRALKMQPVIR